MAILESSDRRACVRSLELIRELDFDVIVPWVVDANGAYLFQVDAEEREDQIDKLLRWVRQGANGG